MVKILVNVEALQEKIDKLGTLKTECEAIDVTANDLVGSGQSIDTLKSIDAEYTEIKSAIVQLLDNSIQFFTGVKKSAVEADNKAGDGFEMVVE